MGLIANGSMVSITFLRSMVLKVPGIFIIKIEVRTLFFSELILRAIK